MCKKKYGVFFVPMEFTSTQRMIEEKSILIWVEMTWAYEWSWDEEGFWVKSMDKGCSRWYDNTKKKSPTQTMIRWWWWLRKNAI
jgi:hypothetical protein